MSLRSASVTKEAVLNAIYSAIDEINGQLDGKKKLVKSPDTVLFGNGGVLDSLGLVSLTVAVEQTIEEKLGIALTIANEKAFSQKSSPFRTVSSLGDFIVSLLEPAS